MQNYRVKFQEKLELKRGDAQFIKHKEHFYSVSIRGNNAFTIIDMTEAGKRGKKCPELSLNSEREAPDCAFWNELLQDHCSTLLEATTAQTLPEKLFQPYFRFYLNEIASKDLLPLDLNIIKPLKAMPKKWTLPHVIRALVNGQYENLKKNLYLTDDYLWDYSVNFREGEIKDPIAFIEGILRNKSGWSAWPEKDGTVSVCQYSFDSNEFTPKIEEAKTPKKEKAKNTEAEKSEDQEIAEELNQEEVNKILKREGLVVCETMTNPKRADKKPRPVWQVSGKTQGLESIFCDLGCSRRRWQEAFSFWNGGPSLEIVKAIEERSRLSFAEQQERKEERAGKRVERFKEYSDNATKRADQRMNASDELVNGIPMGQPILVGHHSEGRHRRTLERSHRHMRKLIEETKKAEHYERRAESISYRLENQKKDLFYLQNRIKENEARLRKLEREKSYFSNYQTRKEELEEKLAYFKQLKSKAMEERKEEGEIVATPDTLAKGDLVKYIGDWYPVIRANKKSVTIGNWHGMEKWTWKASYEKISDIKKSFS